MDVLKNKNGTLNWVTMLVFTIFFFSMIHLVSNDVFASDSVAQIYDSTYGQDGDNTILSMNFDSESFVQSNFTHRAATNSRLYVNETGSYKVSYSCVWEVLSGTNVRRIYQNSIRVNGATDLVPSESDVYLRGTQGGSQGGGHISSTSATLLVNLTNGDYIELRGGEDPGDTGNGQTENTDECFLTAQKLNTRAIEVYDNTGGQNIQNGHVVVNLNDIYHNGDQSLYVLNNDQVNVSEDGWYKVTYTSCVDQATPTTGYASRQSPTSWIRKNGNENISLSFSYAGYTRRGNGGGDKNCNRANTLINLTDGDYIELQTGLFDRDTSEQIDTIADQSWLLMEKVELDSTIISINNSGQQMDHAVPAAVSFDLNDKLGNYITHTGSSSQIKFTKAGLYELAYNIGYQDQADGERVITCGYLRKNGNTILSPTKQCIYTRADAQARTGTLSTTSIINVSDNDFIEILLNVTGESGGGEYVQVQKGTTWFTVVKINETPRLNWNVISSDLGDGNISAGDLTEGVIFNISGEGQTNTDLTCISGDCSEITDDWTDGTTLIGTDEYKTVTFTCLDNTVGSYNATFRINSSQDTSGDDVWVACDINQSYAKLGLVLNNPSVGAMVNVVENDTQLVNATLTCSGATDSYCGNVSLYSRYNHTGSGMTAVNTTIGDTPFWTNYTNPQYCNLFNGESCTVIWLLNATGTVGDMFSINVNATSNFSSEVPYNETGNFTINITEIPPGTVTWNLVDLAINPGGLNLGDTSSTAKIQPGSDHTRINVTCNQGDCFNITDNWVDETDLNDGVNTDVTFTCDDGHVGTYWAVFAVNSTEDNSPSDINVTCEITQTYGELNITVIAPPEAQTTQVNYLTQFDVNVSVECEGTLGASCGTPSANIRYFEKTLDYGDGSDGILTVTTTGRIINNYTYVTGNEASGQNNITVNDGTEFSVGDEILIIQMQDGLATGVAGQYEFANISSITGGGNDLILSENLTLSYGSGSFDTTSASATQVVRVPQYTMLNVTSSGGITAPAWDGYSGGIVVFRSRDNVTLNGYINVSHLGFRGGDCNGCGNGAFGDQGEGTTGTGTSSTGSNSNGGGGGDGSTGGGEPGGGGGHASSGSNGAGSSNPTGGTAIGYANLSTIHFGGGAGAGGDPDGRTPLPQDVDGGGIVIAFSKNIYNANILAKGETGRFGSSGPAGGVSGSGAGGTIWIAANYMNLTDVNASGGPSVNGDGGDIGGSGADGRIRLDYLDIIGSSSDPAQGYTSSDYLEAETVITNAVTDTPFQIIGAQALTCSGEVFVGNACSLEWSVNVTSSLETTYKINSNASTNEISVPVNKSGNSTVSIKADPVITVISPANNSKHVDSDTLWANITSTVPIVGAYYYLDGDSGTVYNMSNTSSVNWQREIINASYGLHNITFLYNKSDTIQNSTSVYYFTYLKDANRRITKAITSVSPDMYLIDILLENNEAVSKNSTLVDFADDNYIAGSFTPSYDYFNLSSGLYTGTNYIWNLTLVPLSNNEFNYSLAGVGDYEMLDAFIIGLD